MTATCCSGLVQLVATQWHRKVSHGHPHHHRHHLLLRPHGQHHGDPRDHHPQPQQPHPRLGERGEAVEVGEQGAQG